MDPDVLPGQSFPLGATVLPGGVNFCVCSRNATSIELLLFDHPTDPAPARTIRLDPEHNRTFYYWHAFVRGLGAGQIYAYRAHGPFVPNKGLRFDGEKALVDPYAFAVLDHLYDRAAAQRPGDNVAQALRSVVVDPRAYDWEGDTLLEMPFAGSVIYELHVRGFTRHPSSGVAPERAGTYAGLIEKIPYLQDLGVSTIELLPVQQFDEQDAPTGLTNYWGYSPIAFFAPHRGYSSRGDPLGAVDEFRDMVKALHRAGIEVILDVVFNHTAEGGAGGPTLSLRGLENRAYYIQRPGAPEAYADYTGCGNTVNANHSVTRRMILDCLRHWVRVMHVDGFRFDLASVLARDETGKPLASPPILWEIESDPVLAGTKIIAEAWDAGGLYQVGSFIGHRWAEWNAHFRDDVRRFVKSDEGTVAALAARLTGSRDIYPQPGREPNRSINFVTAHDGFTLNDLVSYNERHNAANLRDNTDGLKANYSWNCGAEGPTNSIAIETLRARQIRNFITILLVAQGTPMLLMGDEVRRTQGGNNNPFDQDNPATWFDWTLVQTNADLRRFVRGLIHFVNRHQLFHEERFWIEEGDVEITWHGVRLEEPDWSDWSHSLAFELSHSDPPEHLHVMLNAYWEALDFELPALPSGRQWHRVANTALPSPEDFADPPAPLQPGQKHYTLHPRSAAILKAL